MTAYTIWTKEEYQERASVVAPKLLGQYLIHRTAETTYIGRIVETEAYGGSYRRMADDGAHSFRGLTKRTEPMFCAGGVSYVYLIYGMYHCVNIVTGPEGSGQAVLIRAVEPVAGIEHMLENRCMEAVKPAVSNGPGKLCRAMDITLARTDWICAAPSCISPVLRSSRGLPSCARRGSTSTTPSRENNFPGVFI